MTSMRQVEANRRNAENSTGPRTDAGKQRSALNALRHGLTAETVALPLEDPLDYQAFEEAVLSGFDPETAVERELVLRVASLLWRLRRAVSVETGLFQLADDTVAQRPTREPQETIVPLCPDGNRNAEAESDFAALENQQRAVASRFLKLGDWDGVLERMSRYELALWRQLRQTLFMLDALTRRRALTQNYRRSRWSEMFPLAKCDSDR